MAIDSNLMIRVEDKLLFEKGYWSKVIKFITATPIGMNKLIFFSLPEIT